MVTVYALSLSSCAEPNIKNSLWKASRPTSIHSGWDGKDKEGAKTRWTEISWHHLFFRIMISRTGMSLSCTFNELPICTAVTVWGYFPPFFFAISTSVYKYTFCNINSQKVISALKTVCTNNKSLVPYSQTNRKIPRKCKNTLTLSAVQTKFK